MSYIPPFARTVGLYATKPIAPITPRWYGKNFGVVKPWPESMMYCSEAKDEQLRATYKMPASWYIRSAGLALIAGWHIGNRMHHEWPMQFSQFEAHFPAHH